MKQQSILEKYHFLYYFYQTIIRVINTQKKMGIIYIIANLILICLNKQISNDVKIIFSIISVLTFVSFFLKHSDFLCNLDLEKKLSLISFYNKDGIVPYIIDKCDDGNTIAYQFCSIGIPLETWKKQRLTIENVLDVTIHDMYMRKNNQVICVECTKGLFNFYATHVISDVQLSEKKSKIVLGINGSGVITCDFADTPHLLIGGATGSGKSVLIKSILYQCIQKNHSIYIVDFKWGVDYNSSIWHSNCNFVTELDDLLSILTELNKKMIERYNVLNSFGYTNIDDFNASINHDKMPRIILAIDECADVIESKVLSKEDKERSNKIISLLTELTRKSRAVAINIILATQRPDAVVIPSSIKNNVSYRIAGKCDQNLSQIILDNSDADERIPKNTNGVFLDNFGHLFKAFYYDNRSIDE